MESVQTTTHEKEETKNLVDIQLQRLYHIIHESIFMCFPKNFTSQEVDHISDIAMRKIVDQLNKLLIKKTKSDENSTTDTPGDR